MHTSAQPHHITQTPDLCCSICANTTACVAFSWHLFNDKENGNCWLTMLPSTPGHIASPGFVSGTVPTRPTPPPTPPVPTPPTPSPAPPHPKPGPAPVPPHSQGCPNTTAYPWCDPTEPLNSRVSKLIATLTLEEKATLFTSGTQGIARIGWPKYGWWSEALHGVARGCTGVCTSWPQVIGIGSTFNTSLFWALGDMTSTEGRAMNGGLGKTYWAPNVNIMRDVSALRVCFMLVSFFSPVLMYVRLSGSSDTSHVGGEGRRPPGTRAPQCRWLQIARGLPLSGRDTLTTFPVCRLHQRGSDADILVRALLCLRHAGQSQQVP